MLRWLNIKAEWTKPGWVGRVFEVAPPSPAPQHWCDSCCKDGSVALWLRVPFVLAFIKPSIFQTLVCGSMILQGCIHRCVEISMDDLRDSHE